MYTGVYMIYMAMLFSRLTLGWGVYGHVHGNVLGPCIFLDFHLADTRKVHKRVLGSCVLLNVIFNLFHSRFCTFTQVVLMLA